MEQVQREDTEKSVICLIVSARTSSSVTEETVFVKKKKGFGGATKADNARGRIALNQISGRRVIFSKLATMG